MPNLRSFLLLAGLLIATSSKAQVVFEFNGIPSVKVKVIATGQEYYRNQYGKIVIPCVADSTNDVELEVITSGIFMHKHTGVYDCSGEVIYGISNNNRVLSRSRFNQSFVPTIQQASKGQEAGVETIEASGSPNAAIEWRLRGGYGNLGRSAPLIMLDGMPILRTTQLGENPLSFLDPAVIEEIAFEKNAYRVARSGARGNEGVIHITTRKGAFDQNYHLSHSSQFAFHVNPAFREVYSADAYRAMINEQSNSGPLPFYTPNFLGNGNTDWQGEITEDSWSMNHTIRLYGAYEDMPFSVSYNYLDHNGVIQDTENRRNTFSFNFSPSLPDNSLRLFVAGMHAAQKKELANENLVQYASLFNPTSPVRSGNTLWGGYYFISELGSATRPNSIAPINPVALINLSNHSQEDQRLQGQLRLEYDIPFLTGLTVKGQVGMDRLVSDQLEFTSGELATGSLLGSNTVSLHARDEFLHYQASIDYKINVQGHLFATSVGLMRQKLETEQTSMSRYVSNPVYDSFSELLTLSKLRSIHTHLGYSYNGFVNISALYKNEGYSMLSEEVLQTYAGELRLDIHGLLGITNLFSGFDLTTSYSSIDHLPIFSEGNYAEYEMINNVPGTALQLNGYKPANLQLFDVGVDIELFRERLRLSMTYYRQTNKDEIFVVKVPGSPITNGFLVNGATIKNSGLELVAEADVINQKKMDLKLGVNLNFQKNEVSTLNFGDDIILRDVGSQNGREVILTTGQPINSFWLLQHVYDQFGNPLDGVYQDTDGSGRVNDGDRQFFGNSRPSALGGFYCLWSYGRFGIQLQGDFRLGHDVYDAVGARQGYYNGAFPNRQFLSNIATTTTNTNFRNQQLSSAIYLQDASHLTINNISLIYKPKGMNQQGNRGSIMLSLQNFFRFSAFDAQFTETASSSLSYAYPRSKSIVFGLKVDLHSLKKA